MSSVSAGALEILLFLIRSSNEFEKKSDSLQTFGFFSQINYYLTTGFPIVLHRLFHPSSEQQLGKNNIHLR